jgi:hypothetical protein
LLHYLAAGVSALKAVAAQLATLVQPSNDHPSNVIIACVLLPQVCVSALKDAAA